MRFDRLLTIGVAGPIHRFIAPSRRYEQRMSGLLPVLMYHSISATAESARHAYYNTCTSPERFRQQMEALVACEWRAISLGEALQSLSLPTGARGADEKLVALTFDDGYRDFYTDAFPILACHGFRATVYLPTAYIAHERKMFKSRACLTWAEVTELHACGIEFGSHTVSHPNLVDLPWPLVEAELRTSKAVIEQRLGERVPHFAYPYAFPSSRSFRSRFRTTLQSVGYESCATTDIGRTFAHSDPLLIKRLPVNDDDDPALFAAKLEGGYDWVGVPQSTWKHLKAVRHDI